MLWPYERYVSACFQNSLLCYDTKLLLVDMSRDKGGAASVAGFIKTVSMLGPKHINITAGLSLVRNSVGPDSYVSDEVIYSRNGTRGKFSSISHWQSAAKPLCRS